MAIFVNKRSIKRFVKSILLLLIISMFSGCIARKAIILPTRYDREMLQARYHQCITRLNSLNYNDAVDPNALIRSSFVSCRGARQAMLSSYPRRWHAHYAEKIDKDIYASELAWIEDKRH